MDTTDPDAKPPRRRPGGQGRVDKGRGVRKFRPKTPAARLRAARIARWKERCEQAIAQADALVAARDPAGCAAALRAALFAPDTAARYSDGAQPETPP